MEGELPAARMAGSRDVLGLFFAFGAGGTGKGTAAAFQGKCPRGGDAPGVDERKGGAPPAAGGRSSP